MSNTRYPFIIAGVCKGYIRLLQMDCEPYEAFIEMDGHSYHVIFGHQINGNFLCVPGMHLGVELSGLGDYLWNKESLLKAKVSKNWAEAFAQGLVELEKFIS